MYITEAQILENSQNQMDKSPMFADAAALRHRGLDSIQALSPGFYVKTILGWVNHSALKNEFLRLLILAFVSYFNITLIGRYSALKALSKRKS